MSICRRNWRAALAMVLPGILGGVTMIGLGHPLWPRFFFFALGFALLIVVEGVFKLPRLVLGRTQMTGREQLAKGTGFALAALMVLASMLTLPRYYAVPKQDFTGARDYIERNRKPGEAVVAVGLAGVAYSRYFASNWLVAHTKGELDAVRRQHSSTWLVYTIPAQLDALNPDFWPDVQNQFRVVKIFPGTLNGGAVFVCQPLSGANLRPSDANKPATPGASPNTVPAHENRT
jgi:hypothetical protein